MGVRTTTTAVMLALLAGGAFAAEGAWETVAETPYLIKMRAVPNSNVKEIWAEGDLDAPAQDIQAAIEDPDSYSKFMPFVKESRIIGKPEADGTRYVYTRLDFGSLVASRDYVVKVKTEQSVAADGTGEFRQRWVAEADRLPKRANSIRVRVDEGSWQVTPKGDGKSHVVYRFLVDPGGWVPGFAANMGNKQGVSDTLKAVEKEAQRRCKARQAASANP